MRTFWKATHYFLALALRQRIAWVAAAGGAGLIAVGALFRGWNFRGAEARFLTDFSTAATLITCTLTAVLMVPGLYFSTLRNGTAVTLLMHGVRRPMLVAAQIAAALVVIGWVLSACGISYIVLMHRLGHEAAWQTGWADLVRAAALPSIVLVFATVCLTGLCRGQNLASLLAGGLALAGWLATPASRAAQDAGGTLSVAVQVLRLCLPDFSLLTTLPTGWALCYAGALIGLYTTVATWLFCRREL